VAGRGEASLSRVIEKVLADLDLRTRFREQLAVSSWPQIAGRVVAAHSRAEAVRDGVLIVATDTAAWANELQMRRQELLELLAGKVGRGVIREIHFRAGARRRGRHGRQPRPRPSEVRLSGRQEKRIAEAAEKIEDADLRKRAERAFASLARISEWRKRGGWRRCRRCGQWQRVGRRWCASCTYSGRRRRKR
jgi:predicted nucleic acid-binding Zn ribbon protein